jgi:hypothetical protein
VSEETLFTAARRIVRFIRSDDEAHGGLLSQDTIQANETLAIMVALEARREKERAGARSDAVPEPGQGESPE